MKRDNNIFNYGHAVRQQDIIENSVVPELVDEPLQESHSSFDSFIRLVYALDEHRVPTGDLAYMVSDKANPEVKQWVLQNLLMDVSAAASVAAPEGVSDDDILALSRDPRESSQDYMNRVNDFARNNLDLYERLARSSKESLDSRKNVPIEPELSPVPSE